MMTTELPRKKHINQNGITTLKPTARSVSIGRLAEDLIAGCKE